MNNIKIIFMGTPEFAVPALTAIHSKFGISAVVTVPDKPKGRGLKLFPSPVKEKAIELNIPVYQPEKLKDESFIKLIRDIEPDIIVVIAFRILPKELFIVPKLASFNIHGSLLPKYRGAAPINHAIINGEVRSGLTSFILQEKVDTGNILLKKEVEIGQDMTAGELHDILMSLAADLSIETIELLKTGNYTPLIQDDALSSPAPKLTKENTRINWNMPADKILNLIRGLSPYPSAWTNFNDGPLKILKAVKLESQKLENGKFLITKNQFLAGTIDADISITYLQPPNKKAMPIGDFLNGYRGDDKGIFI